MIRVLDLFSGIGGFSLGLERTGGFRTVAFCEIDAFARRVLAKHWPEVPAYEDVRSLTAARLAADGIGPVDAAVGGFPCQDVSIAGKGAGLAGERSGLWVEFSRIVGEVRPRWVVVENVPPLRSRGGDRVLADLEEHGYACWPVVVGAVHAGAPHRRQRVWIVAHALRDGSHQQRGEPGEQGGAGQRRDQPRDGGAAVAHAGSRMLRDGGRSPAPAAAREIRGEIREQRLRPDPGPGRRGDDVGLAGGAGLPQREGAPGERPHAAATGAGWWHPESRVGGGADGLPPGLDGPGGVTIATPTASMKFRSADFAEGRVPNPAEVALGAAFDQAAWERGIPRTVPRGFPQRVPRLKALGNAVVPQVVEMLGNAILAAEADYPPPAGD